MSIYISPKYGTSGEKRKGYKENVSDETGYGPGKVVEIILKFMAVIQAKLPSISKVNNWSDSATN